MALPVALLKAAQHVQLLLVPIQLVLHKNFAQLGPLMVAARVARLVTAQKANRLAFLQALPGTQEMLAFEGAQEVGGREDTIGTLEK